MKIHHIGYLVENMEEAMNTFFAFGGGIAQVPVFDHERLVDIAFVKIGDVLIELVSPREESEDVGKSIRRLKTLPYHLCFECSGIEKTIAGLVEKGCLLIKEPQKAIALDNREVAFLYSSSIGLFELLDTNEAAD